MEWISTAERLPAVDPKTHKSKNVLFTMGVFTYIGRYYAPVVFYVPRNPYWVSGPYARFGVDKIDHWAELPETPYEKETGFKHPD